MLLNNMDIISGKSGLIKHILEKTKKRFFDNKIKNTKIEERLIYFIDNFYRKISSWNTEDSDLLFENSNL